MPEVIFVASWLTIIESTVMLLQFEKLIKDDRESVALAIKFLKGGVFWCPRLLWISREEGLRTCGGILGITHFEPYIIYQ